VPAPDPRKTDPRTTFGKRVRKLRTEQGLTLEKLAELADLHPNYVGSVERGERNIALINIVRLARALRVKAGILIDPI
jgi:transcriptional regulator with XRE-family HTH domain